MVIQHLMLSLCAVIVLSGCKSTKTADYSSHLLAGVETPTSLDKTHMQIYIASAESQLMLLEQQESKRCITGQLTIAHTYLSRATAEYNAGMDKDAFITLLDLDRQVRKIRCINKYINGQLGCSYTNKKVVLKRWYDEGDYNQCEIPAISTVIAKAESTGSIGKKHMLITETLHDFNQEQIKAIYFPSLNKLIELVKRYPKSTLLITGHTDSKGSSAYNRQLSKRRAQSVAKYFTDQGVNFSRIVIKNAGEENIREVEKSDVSRVFNRYTSITLLLDTSDKIYTNLIKFLPKSEL
ncbi:OmpA family protein [Colwellia piezophila]|uniref:OmpA family protein n=1 Tax=Colwellia piezophila TaxID=211668 RepID=UPI000364255B|nr:OmpA family protein [Colwellia piezophila]